MKKLLVFVLPMAWCLAVPAHADTAVVFNEIMFHPATNEPALEWVELRNQMAVDIDISDWSLDGGIHYTFASNTIVRGGALVVIALSPTNLTAVTGATNVLGPFAGRLSNNGGTLRLRNNSGRLVDEVNYSVDGDWPVAPDGSGVSLAKRDRDSASRSPENWTSSEQTGGTPGAENFAVVGAAPTDTRLLAVDAIWKYEASGNDLGTAWRDSSYSDNSWSSRAPFTNRAIAGLFNTGVGANGVALAPGTSDPHYILTVGAQGTPGMNALAILNHPSWLANDAASTFIGVVNPGVTTINGGDYYFQTTFSLDGFIPSTARININVAVDNDLSDVFINGTGSGLVTSGFAAFSPPLTLASGFVAGTNTLEFRTINQGAGPGGFRATLSGTALTANTNSPLPAGLTTYYFRRTFLFSGDPAHTKLKLNPVIADGAIVYLNGIEVFRQNMPPGPPAYGSAALAQVTTPDFSGLVEIPAGSLTGGVNLLAVEVHQAAGSPDGPLFGADLFSAPIPVPPAPPVTLAFNEFSASTNAEFWLELVNYGTNDLSLDGYYLVRDGAVNGEYVFPPGPPLPQGGYIALTNTTLGFHPESGDKLYLFPPARNKVIDAVVVKKAARGRSPRGTGPYLSPNQPTPGAANSFVTHDEIVINEIMYHHQDTPGTNGQPSLPSKESWVELYNKSSGPVDLNGWEIDGGITYRFFNKTLAAGGYVVVAKDAAALRLRYPSIDIVGDFGKNLSGSSDSILLRDAAGNPADQVRYFDSGRWPVYADGGGSSLELRDPNADNGQAEAWAASDETGKGSWQTYSYRMVANIPAGSGQPTTWNDLVLGLQSAGECLIDDISVLESPASSPVEFIANGNFENGLTGWRVLGTHGHSFLDVDPSNPGNHVLHVVSSGIQEHMHNHIEATYTAGRAVVNTREYQISYRAKWLAGNNLLNTRLYFNRVARTTVLPTPQLNGTPGTQNSRYQSNLGPTFSQFGHQPAIPQVNTPIEVSVVAQDPQGVGSCAIWWSANSGTWSNAPMTLQSGGRYEGMIPGFTAGTIVQFYVRAIDNLGAAATYPAGGSNSGALFVVNDGQANLPLAHNVRIILTPANINLLHGTAQGVNQTNVMSNDLLPCTVIYDEQRAYYDCGVHLRGSQRGRYSDNRTGFHINFPPDDLFRGVHPVMLIDRSGAGDATANRQEEIVLKHILNRAGGIPGTYSEICRLIAPRSVHTGPAQFFPRHEDVFLESAFENGGDGTLFEMELIYYPTTANAAGYKLPQPDLVLGTDMTDLGSDKELYRYNFMLKNHRETDDYSRFIALCKAWSLTGAALDTQTRQLMDIDQWMRAYALISLCSVGDMYSFGNNHNFFIYSRPSDGKFLYFPWDMDFAFTRGATGSLTNTDQVNIGKIVTLPANLRCLYAHMLDIMDVSFNSSYMSYWTDHYDNFAPGQSYAGSLTTIGARNTFARNTINSAGGNAPFNISGTNVLTTSNNLVTLNGTAPVQIKTIWINGAEYPVTWTSLSNWTIRVALSAATNVLNLVGHDVHGRTLTNVNFSRTITVNYTGPIQPPEGKVVFNEIMYDPVVPDASYIELLNSSPTVSFDLSGWRVNGLDYVFPSGSLLTNRQILVLAKNALIYSGAYSNPPAPFAEFDGALQNDGETLTLLRPGPNAGEEIVVDKVRYEAALPWPASPRGTGPSLQLIDPAQDNSRVANWGDGSGWRFYQTNVNLGNAVGPRLYVFLDGPGEVYLDDFSVVALSGPTAGSNLVQNAGFETELTGTWNVGANLTNSSVSTSLRHSGNASFRLVATNAGAPTLAASLSQDVGAVTNTPYTLSYWFLASTNANKLTTRFATTARPENIVKLPSVLSTPGLPNLTAGFLPPFPPLWLNEAQPENPEGITDNNGQREPWLELYNAGTNVISLAGFYLANNYSNLTQWAFPPGATIEPGQFKIIFADGEAAQTSNSEWHTSFRLSPTNGSVALAWTSTGVQVLDYLNYSGIPAGASYGDYPDGQSCERQGFYRVTPGGTNDGSSAPIAISINEWMAENVNGLVNTNHANRRDDWFELFNPSDSPANLAGYFLTDNLTNKFQFEIPAGYVIPPRSFLLVWADGEPGLNSTNEPNLHVNFSLSKDGDAIGLFAPDGTPIDTVTFEPQFADLTHGRFPDGAASVYFLSSPTPRATNTVWANRYPVLAPIADLEASVDQTATFTANASDPDAPPQILAFTLSAGAPAGAMINPSSGLFSWTPTAEQAGTNFITVRVTDDGSPSLSAARTIQVLVRHTLHVRSITLLPNGDFSFTIDATVGKTYRLEHKQELADPAWLPLGSDTVATLSTLTFTDNTAQPHHFYRVVQLD